MKQKHLRIRLDECLIKQIDLEAEKRGLSRSDTVRALIQIGLDYYSLNQSKDTLVELIKKALDESKE